MFNRVSIKEIIFVYIGWGIITIFLFSFLCLVLKTIKINIKCSHADELFYFIQGSVLLFLSLLLIHKWSFKKVLEFLTNKKIEININTLMKYLILIMLIIIGAGLLDYFSSYYILKFNETDEQKIAYIVGRRIEIFNSPYRFFIYFVATCFLVPLAEEIFFRGILHSVLKEKTDKKFLVIIFSSLIFAVGHIDRILISFIYGLFLGYIYEIEKSIFINFFIHMFLNILSILVTIIFALI